MRPRYKKRFRRVVCGYGNTPKVDAIDLLANAIIRQAADDYRNLLHGKRITGFTIDEGIKNCEDFFESEDFLLLTDIDGSGLANRIRREVRNEAN